MTKLKIVTDSTAYLSEATARALDITVVPLSITFDGESYPEGSRYTNAEFFAAIAKSPLLPTTSQPSVGLFLAAFEQLSAMGAEDIICVLISPGISGTLYAAQAAAQLITGTRIHLFDSGHTVNVQSYMATLAARLANCGQSVAAILRALAQVRASSSLYFIVDTLEYLRKGGRIGGAASLIGTLLQVKPILYLQDGKIELFEKVRTKAKAIARVNALLAEAMGDGRPYYISLMHVAAPQEVQRWAEQIQAVYPGQVIDITEAGQVVGTHVGVGTIGMCFSPVVDSA
ncbi:MAG: DegV family protein [Peptococcaceae bacterium]|nr:DegV family protein [Peptococcaceae bacterium]